MSKKKISDLKPAPFVVTFHGKEGQFIPGIPIRNLTQEMWGYIPKKLQKKALKSGLYKLVAKSNKEN